MSWSIGDRFYFYRNMTDSDTIALGFKGVIDDIIKLRNGKPLYCCDGYGFTEDEIKPIARVEVQSELD